MTSGPRSLCYDCRHLHEVTDEQIFGDEKQTCEAFPYGIPDEIFHGGVEHTDPYKGDNGIQYEPNEGLSK